MNRTFCTILFRTLVATYLSGTLAYAKDEIKVALSIPDRIQLGEPLPVSVRIQNKSDKGITIMEPIIRRFGRDTIIFELQRPCANSFMKIEHPDVYIGGMKIIAPMPYPIRRLAPNESVEFAFSLAYDFPFFEEQRQRLFDTPGKYLLQISIYEPLHVKDGETSVPYDSECRTIQSEISSVVVVAPADIREQQALNALANLPCEYLLYAPFEFRAECHAGAIRDFWQFLNEYSDTRLGRRAALSLGIALSQGLILDDSHAIIETLEKLAHDNDFELRQSALRILSQLKQ
ncbi:MAG: hypothetical protein ILM98_13570 [Kiritimatiellae bacterium]|nr:hypothetical protein [Kiritimatiellia bacterium]